MKNGIPQSVIDVVKENLIGDESAMIASLQRSLDALFLQVSASTLGEIGMKVNAMLLAMGFSPEIVISSEAIKLDIALAEGARIPGIHKDVNKLPPQLMPAVATVQEDCDYSGVEPE